MVFLLIVIFIVIILFEVPEMVKNKYWRELKVFSAFLAVAFTISTFYIMGIPIPSPAEGIEYLIKNILHLNYK